LLTLPRGLAVKTVSDSAELLALERAIQRVANHLDVTTIDDPLTDNAQRQVVAVLTLVGFRLRDLVGQNGPILSMSVGL
jgi:hypothetical protein